MEQQHYTLAEKDLGITTQVSFGTVVLFIYFSFREFVTVD